MDTRTGIIKPWKDWPDEDKMSGFLKDVKSENLPKPKQIILRKRGEVKIGRNDPCPCGSGKKFKRCCLAPPPAERTVGE